MATVTELVDEVREINKTGIEGLHKLGVDVPPDFTTREIMETMNNLTQVTPLLDGTVRFTSEGDTFHLVTGAVGQEVNAPTITPISETETVFYGWYDESDKLVTFPYSIKQGKTEINAVFFSVDLSMEVYDTDTVLGVARDSSFEYKKANCGKAIAGYFQYKFSSSDKVLLLISETESDVLISGANRRAYSTFTYNGKTYYGASYAFLKSVNGVKLIDTYDGSSNVSSTSTVAITQYAPKVLDKYFMVE